MLHKKLLLLVLVIAATACTSVQVSPVPESNKLTHICILNNPAVKVKNFLSVLEKGLARHNISSEVYDKTLPKHCDTHLTYTALRGWDFAPYLTHAEINIFSKERHVGSATYHLRGNGGLSLTKWASTASKINPLLDELLTQHKKAE